MNVLFVNRAPRKMKSSRIWVHDLCEYLKESGHHVAICPKPEAGDYDTVILGKGAFSREAARAVRLLSSASVYLG